MIDAKPRLPQDDWDVVRKAYKIYIEYKRNHYGRPPKEAFWMINTLRRDGMRAHGQFSDPSFLTKRDQQSRDLLFDIPIIWIVDDIIEIKLAFHEPQPQLWIVPNMPKKDPER